MWTLLWGEAMGKATKIALCAMLTALALALSWIERFLPLQAAIPLPGIKFGLANLVTLLALAIFKTRYAFAVLICRCMLGSVFGGGITGLIFSLWGGLLALGVMALAMRLGGPSVYGISILGAAAHNVGQILAAMVLMNSVYIGAYLSALLITALVTGLLTGTLCAGVLRVFPKAMTAVPEQMRR